jgi:antitoxin MazE
MYIQEVVMTVKALQKWGNSIGLRVPSDVLEALKLDEGSLVEITAKGTWIEVRPFVKTYTMDELLKGVKPQREIDWGTPRGGELW